MDIRIKDRLKIKNEVKIKSRVAEFVIVASSLLYYIDIFIISSIAGSRNVRLQDVASVLAFLVLYDIIRSQGKVDRSYQNTVILMGSFLLYVGVTNAIFYYRGDIDAMSIFYIVKEIEFYACFLLIAYFFRNYLIGIYKISNLLMIFIIGYGFYLVATGSIAYYGIGTIFETAPSVSGSIYFACSILSFYLYKIFKNKNFKIYAILTYFLTVFTISKTNILGLSLFYISFFILQRLNDFVSKNSRIIRVGRKKTLIISLFLLFLSILLLAGISNARVNELILGNDTIARITGRFGRLDSSYSFRNNMPRFRWFLPEFLCE